MKVLIVGGGGREHALAWMLARSPERPELLAAPGNPGIARLARCCPVAADDVAGLVELACREAVDLVVVGPERPLTQGLADALTARGVSCFGPSQAAAELEGSKAFAKGIMERAGIPTAAYAVFTDFAQASAFAHERGGRVAVKADGLAAGKGVVVCQHPAEADAALRAILIDKLHGVAGAKVVVEELLFGEEASLIAICDGERFVLLPPAQDHKRVFDGDVGPNTGGMGAYTPTSALPIELQGALGRTIIAPALRQLASEGKPFVGALFAGLMISPEGAKVIEFNARFGDPETQAILLRLRGDILPLLAGAAAGRLPNVPLELHPGASLVVVLAAPGYPGKVELGAPIEGADALEDRDELVVFHAGTKVHDGRLVVAGGRVLTVAARGDTIESARRAAYAACERIYFPGMHFRRDIAHRALGAQRGG